MDYREFKSKYRDEILFTNRFANGSEYEITPDLLQLYDVVETFKKEMVQWYDRERADKENPLSYATQELWYGMYLEKKRLENRGVRMQHAALNHVRKKKRSGIHRRVNMVEFYNDGKYRVNVLGQLTVYNVKYYRNGFLLGSVDSATGYDHMFYYVLRARNKKGLYICPNCGAEMSLEKLMDGCDYCNSKFDISAFNDKVISVNRAQLSDDSRSEDDEIQIWIIIMLISLIFIILIITIIIIAPLCGFGIWRICKLKGEKAVTEMYVNEMYKRNPGMSLEEFVASLDNKIKAIYFADYPAEVAAFVKCNVALFIQANHNTIRCQIGRFKILNYSLDANYQYVEVERSIRVLADMGNHAAERKDILRMRLAKRINHKMKNEISMYTCHHCGSTVSLLEGGICKYCGTMMDYDTCDWVIIDYSIQNSK